MTETVYTIKASAIRGAKRALKNKDAEEGVDFRIIEKDARYTWEEITGAEYHEAVAAHHDKAETAEDSAPVKAINMKTHRPEPAGRRDGAVVEKVIEACKCKEGATRAELADLTGWRSCGWNTFFTKLAKARGFTVIQKKREVPTAKGGTKEVGAFLITPGTSGTLESLR